MTYSCTSIGLPEPPWSTPKPFRIAVIGFIGNSWSTVFASQTRQQHVDATVQIVSANCAFHCLIFHTIGLSCTHLWFYGNHCPFLVIGWLWVSHIFSFNYQLITGVQNDIEKSCFGKFFSNFTLICGFGYISN